MKTLLAICTALLITGCSTTVPVVQKFPQVPQELLEACPESLKLVQEPVTLSSLTKTVAENYATYHECALRVTEWIEWYTQQNQIYGTLK
jgi:PBP1b-binding outer membrane lipoprotein LpoB